MKSDIYEYIITLFKILNPCKFCKFNAFFLYFLKELVIIK